LAPFEADAEAEAARETTAREAAGDMTAPEALDAGAELDMGATETVGWAVKIAAD